MKKTIVILAAAISLAVNASVEPSGPYLTFVGYDVANEAWAEYSNFFGAYSGYYAADVSRSGFYGVNAGKYAYCVYGVNGIGFWSMADANYCTNIVAIGSSSCRGSYRCRDCVFIGAEAGRELNDIERRTEINGQIFVDRDSGVFRVNTDPATNSALVVSNGNLKVEGGIHATEISLGQVGGINNQRPRIVNNYGNGFNFYAANITAENCPYFMFSTGGGSDAGSFLEMSNDGGSKLVLNGIDVLDAIGGFVGGAITNEVNIGEPEGNYGSVSVNSGSGVHFYGGSNLSGLGVGVDIVTGSDNGLEIFGSNGSGDESYIKINGTNVMDCVSELYGRTDGMSKRSLSLIDEDTGETYILKIKSGQLKIYKVEETED